MIYFHDTFFLKLALTNNHHHHYHPYSSQNGDGERESITGQFKKTWGVWFSLHHLEESSMASLATPIGLSHGPLTPRCHPPNLGGEPRRIGASYGLNLRQTKDLDWLNGTFGATFQAPLLRVLRDETRRLLHRSRGLKDKLVSRWCQVVPKWAGFFEVVVATHRFFGIFHPENWGKMNPFWLIFFKWVESTN